MAGGSPRSMFFFFSNELSTHAIYVRLLSFSQFTAPCIRIAIAFVFSPLLTFPTHSPRRAHRPAVRPFPLFYGPLSAPSLVRKAFEPGSAALYDFLPFLRILVPPTLPSDSSNPLVFSPTFGQVRFSPAALLPVSRNGVALLLLANPPGLPLAKTPDDRCSTYPRLFLRSYLQCARCSFLPFSHKCLDDCCQPPRGLCRSLTTMVVVIYSLCFRFTPFPPPPPLLGTLDRFWVLGRRLKASIRRRSD